MREWISCVCLWAAIFAASDAAVVVGAAASSSYILPDPELRYGMHTCESAGFLDIENEAECEGAAALLGLHDTTVQNISQTPRFVVAVTNYTDESRQSQLYYSFFSGFTFSAGAANSSGIGFSNIQRSGQCRGISNLETTPHPMKDSSRRLQPRSEASLKISLCKQSSMRRQGHALAHTSIVASRCACFLGRERCAFHRSTHPT